MGRLKDFIQILLGKKKPTAKPNKSFEEEYNDLGAFTYDDTGFTITYEEISKTIKWDDITELNVYKIDMMTIDRIDMAIVYGDKQMTISEDLPGWYQFVIRSKIRFPSIPKDWDLKMTTSPAFKRDFTVIYKRNQ